MQYSRLSHEISTRLLDGDRREIPKAIQRVKRWDVMTLATLLQAANLSSIDGPPGEPSLRTEGCNLLLDVACSGRDGGISACDYSVSYIVGARSQSFLVSQVGVEETKVVQKRNGVKIQVRISGSMGAFSWSRVMVAWVS